MRVALLSRAVRPLHDPGGMERSVYHLAKHLQRRGIDTVLLTRPATQPGTFPGEVVTVPYQGFRAGAHGRILDRTLNYPAFALRIGEAVAEKVRAGRVDVVHAQGMTALGYGRLRRKDSALRAPLLLNPQGMEEHKTRGLKWVALARIRALSREAARLADRVIATDEVTRDEVPRYLGVEPSRVVVLPNGVDLEEIDQATPADPERLVRQALPGLGDASPVLVSVGRVERYKGFGDVLEALIRLHARGRLGPKWAWVVLGDGSQRAEMERRIAASDAAAQGLERVRERAGSLPGDLASHIHFAGWVRDDPLLHSFYARSDLFVHATHYEGSSIVTLEAMAHALPVVASRAGGIPDKVAHGESGLLVRPGDVEALAEAMASLASDAGLRRAMGLKGRDRAVQRFGWDTIADRTIAVYEELLAASGA